LWWVIVVGHCGGLTAIEHAHLFPQGLDIWGPVINLNRDPRWGRNGEAGPECPFLMSEFSLATTQGVQVKYKYSSSSSSSSAMAMMVGQQHGKEDVASPTMGAGAAVGPAADNSSFFYLSVVTLKHFDANSLEVSTLVRFVLPCVLCVCVRLFVCVCN
jgi:hypothetical protein